MTIKDKLSPTYLGYAEPHTTNYQANLFIELQFPALRKDGKLYTLSGEKEVFHTTYAFNIFIRDNVPLSESFKDQCSLAELAHLAVEGLEYKRKYNNTKRNIRNLIDEGWD